MIKYIHRFKYNLNSNHINHDYYLNFIFEL